MKDLIKIVDEALGGLKDKMLIYSFKEHSPSLELTTVMKRGVITIVGVDKLLEKGFEFEMSYYDFNEDKVVMSFTYDKVGRELGDLF